MGHSTTLFPPRLLTLWRPWGSSPLRLMTLDTPAETLVLDLSQREPLVRPSGNARSRQLLILTSAQQSVDTRRILQNVGEAVFSRKGFILGPAIKEVQQVFQEHLALERSFFEPLASGLTEADYQGFLLAGNRLYPLHRQAEGTCYLYRQGRLLTYHLTSQQFVRLQLGDILFVASPLDMSHLLENKALQHIALKLHTDTRLENQSPPIPTNPLNPEILEGPVVIIQWPRAEHVAPWHWVKALRESSRFNRDKLLIAAFLLTWLIAIALNTWLKW